MAIRQTLINTFGTPEQVWCYIEYNDVQLRATALIVDNQSPYNLKACAQKRTGQQEWVCQTFPPNAPGSPSRVTIPGGAGWGVTVDANGEIDDSPNTSWTWPAL